ncbi:hypothetical protein HRG84_09015 [Flavisolibacter sp. BT320]|nr:hypothetical protein [Flavisolibacter longurius]
MKNKLVYLTVILLTAITITSCASRKYGCPNTTGIKIEKVSSVHSAI